MNIIQRAGKQVAKHSPEILTGMAVGGLVATVVLAVRATPRALKLLDTERWHQAFIDVVGDIPREEWQEGVGTREQEHMVEDAMMDIVLHPKTIIQIAWKPYLPAMIMGGATIACIIGAHTVSSRRMAALASVYSLTEMALTEYKDKVVETIGEKKEEKIRDEIAADRIKANPISEEQMKALPGEGQLCYDTLSSQYFYSSVEKIRQTINDFNERLLKEDYLGLNEMYYMLGLQEMPLASDLGWRVDNGLVDIKFSAQLADDGHTACIVLDYNIVPKYY